MSFSMPRTLESLPAIASLVALSYAILLGATVVGEVRPLIVVINTMLVTPVIVFWILNLGPDADRLDLAALAALMLTIVSALFSALPRQSLDDVLAALSFTAIFFLARSVLKAERARALFPVALRATSAVVAAVTAATWIPSVIEWSAAAEWRTPPPLDLALHAGPWGHRHDLALLGILLYPAWWIGRPSRVRIGFALLIGAIVLALTILDGSRSLWAGAVLASLLLLLPRVRRAVRASLVVRWTSAVVALVGVVGIAATGLGSSVLTRFMDFGTLGSRGAMWTAVVELWRGQPLTGHGPGTFSWALQETDYFTANAWTPRHPDSVPVQTLAEGGVVGLAAVLLLLVVVGAAVLRGRSTAARWVGVVMVVASVGASTIDFGFTVIVMIAWVAYAAPRSSVTSRRRHRAVTGAVLATAAMIGIAHAATLGGLVLYEDARSAVRDERLDHAEAQLRAAISLDPSLAFYRRQLGVVEILEEDYPSAITELETAIALNGADDLSWRTLALAAERAGNDHVASAALDQALRLNRADPANLLLAATIATDDDDAVEYWAEAVQAWPSIVGTDEWLSRLPRGVLASDIVELAADRWAAGAPSPGQTSPILLSVAANRPELIAPAAEMLEVSEDLATLAADTLRCEPFVPHRSLGVPDRQSHVYWRAQLRSDATLGLPSDTSGRILSIGTGVAVEGYRHQSLNSLNRHGSFADLVDVWGYHREPIQWPTIGSAALPSPRAGVAEWTMGLREAWQLSGLEIPPGCKD